ncbi:AMP-binding protein, partial [Vibrio sp. Makdt]|uniref:AMP-binding protein n=1 Tax=Vibrio sp. Makdt TaxID=2998828 RepID=UPI0022CD377C
MEIYIHKTNNFCAGFELISQLYPKKIAVIHGKVKISYEELNKRANNVVFGLKELGLKPGDRAGVCIERGE